MPLRSLPSSVAKLAVAPVTALAVLTAGTSPAPGPATPRAESSTRPATGRAPATAVDPATAVETRAIAVAHTLRAVPADATDRLCTQHELAVRWTAPAGFTHGAYVAPVGPAPGRATTAVNGVVVCGDSTWAYMGFEAVRAGGTWTVTAVPYVEEGHDHPAEANLDADPEHAADDSDHGHGHGTTTPAAAPTVASPSAPTAEVPTSAWLAGLGAIEPYAAYEPQTSCSPTAKPGTVVLRDALLGAHPVTRNLGIARACHIGGRSEHKEGRAFDWGAYVHRPVERAAVERFLTQLFATDADGNRHALARRLGVMYVIWDGRIWSSHRAGDGWRSYHGPSPHTDHVHVSLSHAGGAGRTSFFTADLANRGVLGLVPPGGIALPTGGGSAGTSPVAAPTSDPARAPAPARDDASPHRPRERVAEEQDEAAAGSADHGDELAREREEQARQAEEKAAEAARRDAEKAAEAARREAEKAAEAARREAEQAGRDAEQARPEAEQAASAAQEGRRDDDGRPGERAGGGGKGRGGP